MIPTPSPGRLPRLAIAVAVVAVLPVLALGGCTVPAAYVSPYELRYSVPVDGLTADFGTSPWNDPHLESSTPYLDWYTPATRTEFGSWGPRAARYPVPTTPSPGTDWQRQRVVAAGAHFIGHHYQHHHIPDWDPPEHWPWERVSLGTNSPGIDCSDFTSLAYNYGLGIVLPTSVTDQAVTETVAGPGGAGSLTATRIADPGGYEQLVAALRTGDLLYIKDEAGAVSHVIMWLGAVGGSPDGTPLIMDSHDNKPPVPDANGVTVPAGVRIRPFRANSWYYTSFSHALRWLA